MKNTSNEVLNTLEVKKYKNPELSIKERVDDLISQMTLDEKIAQMMCIWDQKKTTIMDEDGKIDLSRLKIHFKDGLGQIARLSDTAGGLSPKDMAELSNELQRFFIEETRLGIPVIIHEECLHGLAAKEATSYPQPIGLAATFNPSLVEEIYSSVAEDTRARGAHQALTPVVDVLRDPRWGRVEETFGEDPYLVTQMGIAAVRGFQGDAEFKNKKKVIATLKHFAAHGQPESGSNCGPANISERVLRDTFLRPFKETINKAKAISIMPSYNEIDGIPSHANKWLLKDVLRDEWGFKGFLVSDYFAITELNYKKETVSHSLAKDKKEAALLAITAGVNVELPDRDCYPYLKELVEESIIDESVIDELVSVLLEYKFKLGLFDDPYISTEEFDSNTKLEADRELALKAAYQVITLLKNENNLLPLDKNNLGKIAVIGPNADKVMLGGYSGEPVFYTTVLEGIKQKLAGNAEILYSEGCKITIGGSWFDDPVIPSDPEEDDELIKEAVKVAKLSDTVILVLGGNEQTSREAWNNEHMGDRPSLDLVGKQNELVAEILKTGKPTIVILFNGRPNSINFINENVPAIIECWYLGQESGNAIADVLFGDYNPGGKLPVSFPRSAGHIPCHYNHKPSSRRGYLFDDISPLYPFGFGLSYTTFKIDNLQLEKDFIKANESTQISVDIKNTGRRKGEEVVQLYIRDLVSSVTRPVKELKGFKRIKLAPGESIKVEFEIAPEHLAFTNIDKEFKVEPGEFEIMVGNSSMEKDLQKVILTVK